MRGWIDDDDDEDYSSEMETSEDDYSETSEDDYWHMLEHWVHKKDYFY